jgi:dTDP-4-amino-4,6-dideoxygalactose transaminase
MATIPLFKVFMDKNIMRPLKKVLFSGFIGEGPEVLKFEAMVSKKFGCDYVLALNNGTAGLHLAYQMIINYYPENEIICSPMTCSATLTPILANRGKITWADINPITGNIDPACIKVTEKTKAIVAMAWGGMPCDLDALNKCGVPVIQDAAHALGSTWNGEHLAKHSDFTMHSLQAIKHVTSVDGGLLICKDQKYYERAKLLRWYGISRDSNKEVKDLRCELDISETGHKFHMSDVTAVIGMQNFKHLDEIVQAHQANAAYYDSVFAGTAIPYSKALPQAKSSYWLYTIHAKNRDKLMELLKADGIMTSKVHTRNDHHSAFAAFKADLPNVDKFQQTHLCIPVGWWVTKEDREFIVDRILHYVEVA